VTARFPVVEETAAGIVASVLAAPPTLGRTRLVCVDGPAGSGKTTLGAALRRAFRDAMRAQGTVVDRSRLDLVHMDNLYEGWSGLTAGMARMATDVVAPLARGEAGRYRRYDWVRETLAETHQVAPVDVLVVEGVGSGNAAYAEAIHLLAWVETPPGLRLERGLLRDGEHMRDHWLAWRTQEAAMFTAHRTRERAQLRVDGLTGLPVE